MRLSYIINYSCLPGNRPIPEYIHLHLAILELAIVDPLLYRTDCAKICQSRQFKSDNFLLYWILYWIDSRGAGGIDTGINHIEIFISIIEE